MKAAQQLEVARIALAACAERGYALTGSLALHVHGVGNARDADDVDLFVDHLLDDADLVRDGVIQALRAAGYGVREAVAWGQTPEVPTLQNAELVVDHPEHGQVRVQMVCVVRYLKAVERGGMPVNTIGQCLYDKIEVLNNRLQAKDFIDLSLLSAHMRQANADRYISMYVTGLAAYQGRPENEVARDLYQAFAQVAQVPDEAFAAYGYTPDQAVQVRTAILTWADRLVAASHPLRREVALAAGRVPVTYDQAQAALTRMAAEPSLTRLSDLQLSTIRAEATSSLLHAAAGQQDTYSAQQQLQPISRELARRADLTPDERAVEDAVRRAEEAERIAGGDPGRLGPLGIIARLTPSPATPPRPPRQPDARLHQQHTTAQALRYPDTGR